MTVDWETLSAAASVSALVGGAGWKTARTLGAISRAVLGDSANKVPGLGDQLTDLRTAVDDLGQTVRDTRDDQARHGDRLTALEATERANSRAARHAIRNLQHQVGALYGVRGELPPPAPADPFEDYVLPLE